MQTVFTRLQELENHIVMFHNRSKDDARAANVINFNSDFYLTFRGWSGILVVTPSGS